MDFFLKATEFENRPMLHMSTSDRVKASRKAKELVLTINEIHKKTKDARLMDIMKRPTVKKRKIEKGQWNDNHIVKEVKSLMPS